MVTEMTVIGAARPSAGPTRIDGKFFTVGAGAFPFRGVCYGTFRPRDIDGSRFPAMPRVRADVAQMAESGFTVVRTYTTPPDDVLDAFGSMGMRALVGVFYPDWRYLLGASRRDASRLAADAREVVRRTARRFAGDDRVFALNLGNEIPADVVRWYGADALGSVLNDLVDVVRQEDADRLVTYANYPSAEYLPLPDLDFLMFNVFLDGHEDLRSYLNRLHQLAGDRPLVLGEIGAHVTEGADAEQAQADFLDAQLAVVVERGVAGACLFSWTDDWWVGDEAVEGWRFGLTRADRSPRPSLEVASRWNERTIADIEVDWPTLSVVVCAYNEQATIDECLSRTCALDYPDLEVIVVDDGSSDRTAEIVREHPRAQLLTIEHAGLAVARNAGLQAARGSIVAYLDADAYPSPQWPYYLVAAFDARDVGGAGGPNVPPPGDPIGAHVVAQSPGGPVHVLLTDDRAEHLPGCNMAFWKDVLEAVGGFDPIYTSAGDDVDLCWKVLDRHWAIGFHPAALVWHHRRAGLRTYLRQQRGYGRAESLVEARHPDRFSAIGTARWQGRIYGSFGAARGRHRVYYGAYGSAAYQSIYRVGGHGLDLAHQVGVPVAVVTAATAPATLVSPLLGLPAVAACLFLVLLAVIDAQRARPPRHVARRAAFRINVAIHHLLQPLVRSWGRRRSSAGALRDLPGDIVLPGPTSLLAGGVVLVADTRPRPELVADVVHLLRRAGRRTGAPTGWEDYDAQFPLSVLTLGELVSSSHPDGYVQLRVRSRFRRARLVLLAIAVAIVGVGTFTGMHQNYSLILIVLAVGDLAVSRHRATVRIPGAIRDAAAGGPS